MKTRLGDADPPLDVAPGLADACPVARQIRDYRELWLASHGVRDGGLPAPACGYQRDAKFRGGGERRRMMRRVATVMALASIGVVALFAGTAQAHQGICTETTNPHGQTTPPAGSTTLPFPNGGPHEEGVHPDSP